MTQAAHRLSRGLLALAAVLLVAASLLVASPALAHDRLISSDPAADSTVTGPLDQITLSFSAVIGAEEGASEVQVTDASGTVMSDAPYAEREKLIIPIVEQGSGEVTVLWKVVSSDGHPISGEFMFTLEPGEAAPEPTETSAEPSPSASESETATPSETPVPEQTATPEPEQSDSASSALPWVIVGVVVVVAVIIAVLYLVVSRKRREAGSDASSRR